LDRRPTGKLVVEEMAKAIGVQKVNVVDPGKDPGAFERLVREGLQGNETVLIIARRPCLLAAKKIREHGPDARTPDAHGQ
jgi:indolepyruvate ferredoxin oxidoreductase alpha subunit